jgi:bifunctional NMN adenylyltransferase/nudix hydrolase
MKYQKGLFIGRFQPIHHGHIHVIKAGLVQCEQLILLIGSIRRAPSVKNPWSYEQRVEMIRAVLAEHDQAQGTDWTKRVIYRGIEDQLYDDAQWFADIDQIVKEASQDNDRIAVVGHDKDASTWYLSCFEHWDLLHVENYQELNATPIRHAYFSENLLSVQNQLPPACILFLKQFSTMVEYQQLCDEYQMIQRFKKEWSHTPYPSIFVTTDSVVICKDHLLLIRRGRNPGKGLWALPGGFLEAHERIETGLLRELREETSIGLSDETLRQALKMIKPFDHPDRAQLGRIITNGGWFELQGEFPDVKAADDAAEIQWYPLSDLDQIQDQLHDDHYQIVKYYLKQMKCFGFHGSPC